MCMYVEVRKYYVRLHAAVTLEPCNYHGSPQNEPTKEKLWLQGFFPCSVLSDCSPLNLYAFSNGSQFDTG